MPEIRTICLSLSYNACVAYNAHVKRMRCVLEMYLCLAWPIFPSSQSLCLLYMWCRSLSCNARVTISASCVFITCGPNFVLLYALWLSKKKRVWDTALSLLYVTVGSALLARSELGSDTVAKNGLDSVRGGGWDRLLLRYVNFPRLAHRYTAPGEIVLQRAFPCKKITIMGHS